MRGAGFDLETFLDRYRELITAIARLARSVDSSPERLLEELTREPFAMPGFVRGLEGARDLGEGFTWLAAELLRDRASAMEPELYRARMRAVMDAFDIHEAHAMLGGSPDAGFDGAVEETPVAARAPAVASRAASAPTSAPTPAQSNRWINAEIEDHSLDEPLEVDTTYTIAFDVDVARRAAAVPAPLDDRGLFPPGVEEVTLTVQLGGPDFTIVERARPLRVPKTGRSRGKARFDVTPTRAGRVTLEATFHVDGNFVQQMEIVLFSVAAGHRAENPPAVSVTSLGRPLGAVGSLRPRDFGFVIKPAPASGYDCTAWGSGFRNVTLPVQTGELETAITVARQALLDVVMQRDSTGNYPFQTGYDIPATESDRALRTLSRAGALLFEKVFYHPAAGQEARDIGDALRTRAVYSAPSKIQIMARDFPVPWGMMYVGDVASGARLDWRYFLGFGHVLEQLPLEARFSDAPPTIASTPRLAVSVNVNSGIDKQMKKPFVADQKAFWETIAGKQERLNLRSRTTRAEVLQAFGASPDDDQIAYFYCHADSADLGATGGPGRSCLVMSGDERITLDDLNVEAPTRIRLAGSPLVFINACESAELSPAFYDGFVPYFMAKGARGVIGTECKTPALFAAEWARRFFDRFLSGEPIGDAFLALRHEFLAQHRNPLGLLYAVHCDGDTLVAPALSA